MTALVPIDRDAVFAAYQAYMPQLLERRPQGVIVLSASQIERFTLCKRWWALEYLFGIRFQHDSAKLGDEVHKHLENWLREARPIPANSRSGRIARMMVRHLPLPGSGTPERKFYFRTRHGHYYTGRMDWSGVLQDMLAGIYNTFVVTGIDHKTTKEYGDYGKTEADLHADIQATIYAIALFVGFETSLVDLFWNYGETKKKDPQVIPVKTRVHLPIVFAKFDSVIEPIAADILLLHEQRPHPLHLPPTVSSCDAFGGCPHRDYCNITEEERLIALMASNPPDNSMASRMMGAYAGGPPNGGPPAYPPQGHPQQQQAGAPPGYGAPPPSYPQSGAPPGYGAPLGYGPPQNYQQPPQLPPGYPQQQQPPQGAPPGYGPPPGYQQNGQLQQLPPGYAPPGAPPQQQLPPQPGPNAPEAGAQLPQQAAEEGKTEGKGKGRGRPAGSKNKELGAEDTIFLAGIQGMLANPSFDGNPERLKQAGEAAVAAMRARLA